MSTVADIEALVLQRLEEDTASPKFWTLQDEIRPAIVEAMMEATIITGEPEIRRSSLFTISANTTIFTMPSDAIALLRIEGPGYVPKYTLWDLDQLIPNWQTETAPASNNVLKAWFPIGLTRFGVYPKLTADISVILAYIGIPVTAVRPFAGTENAPFQEEFVEMFADYAAHVLRLKEGGADFIESSRVLDRFLSRASELSRFAVRKGSLRFTRTVGAPVGVTVVEQR